MEEQILIAAEKLFLDKGFAMTSTADIAREAGCNTALIHYYYRTKRNLFQTVFQQKIKLFLSSFMNIPLEKLDFEERLTQIILTHFNFIRENPKLPFLLLNEVTTNPKSIVELKKGVLSVAGSIIDVVQQEIDKQVAMGQIRPIRAVDLMLNIGTLNVMTFLAMPVLEQLGSIDKEQFIENRKNEIVKTIINSLRNE